MSVDKIALAVESIARFPQFQYYYTDNLCWRAKINSLYQTILIEKQENLNTWIRRVSGVPTNTDINPKEFYLFAAEEVYRKKLNQSKILLDQCLRNKDAQDKSNESQQDIQENFVDTVDAKITSPFDRRLDRVEADETLGLRAIRPYDVAEAISGTIGYIVSKEYVEKQKIEKQESIIAAIDKRIKELQKDDYYTGVPSLINTYAITKLYRSRSGQYLTNQKNQRKWYEVDETVNNYLGFSLNPTTSSLISWGNEDPYGRTPYHFTDFVFCKHWNVVPNNRMITLRRYAAPIVDNLKFPGMYGNMQMGTPGDDNQNQIVDENGNATINTENAQSSIAGAAEQGSNKRIEFPPMATAITYFGEETENNLSDILKFTTGVNWDDAKADLWEVNSTSTPEAGSGPGDRLFPGLARLGKMFNVASGNWNNDAVLNQGGIPPDPYTQGPYENQIIGPVNRIDSVKKRAPGLKYENTISLKFHYVARPVGGINTKAVLLDILSNFLVIGSASAMFWGGQNRFMGNPVRYPFLGGDKGIQQWYSGKPLAWAGTTINEFSNNLGSIADQLGEGIKGFFNALLGKGEGGFFGGLQNLFTGDGIASNLIKNYAAEKSGGQIPYLTGMKALLVGEPVGEWHVTIGNPLNPIAMIGNLICDNIEVEFGNELGPDDFPTELKVTVNLEHGMARDRDAIQSIFNRGMGRIYDLPDTFSGSADKETYVDKYTKYGREVDDTGRNPIYYRVPFAGQGTTGGTFGTSGVKENQMHSGVSIWNRGKFAAVSATEDLSFVESRLVNRSVFRSTDWIAQKSLK